MKKVTAFLTALVLLVGTAAGAHVFADRSLNFHNPEFGTWVSDSKFQFAESIGANLDQDSLVVFGSSEFSHGKDTPYHPENLFAGRDFHPMLVGEGYYQTLFHATALSALGPKPKGEKVALILSPQWFRKKGVRPEAYASRFSELNFIEMLSNEAISEETKEYLVDRSNELLQADPPALKRVKLYERVLFRGNATGMERTKVRLYRDFLEERNRLSVVMKALAAGIRPGTGRENEAEDKNEAEGGAVSTFPSGTSTRGVSLSSASTSGTSLTIDWDAYLKSAREDGKKMTSSNSFGMKDSFYQLRIKPHLERKKDKARNGSYANSPEYDDLRCFLQICREEGIEAMLVLVPVNGKWYDYTGFPKEGREKYYENVRTLASEYGVRVADFSGEEYTDYFFEDNVHLGWEGWVKVNESLYGFAKENAGIS